MEYFLLYQKEKTNSGYEHNSKAQSHGIFNLTFRMLQHTSYIVLSDGYKI